MRSTLRVQGGEYTNGHQLRAGAVLTAARKHRMGLRQSADCLNCPCDIGSLRHILQLCPLAHGARVKQHDSVVAYMIGTLRRLDLIVRPEPRIQESDVS